MKQGMSEWRLAGEVEAGTSFVGALEMISHGLGAGAHLVIAGAGTEIVGGIVAAGKK